MVTLMKDTRRGSSLIRESFRPGDHLPPMKGKEGERRIWASKRLRLQGISDRVQELQGTRLSTGGLPG